ncbi:MAG: SDR family NAD(P)-dependent oxidoreductase [Lautropia sp.]
MADWLHNRNAIVTGAARGVGLAVAQTLALLGARVLMVDNGCAVDGAPEDAAVTELAASRVPGAEPLVIDVAAPGSGERIVEAALRHFGSVDLVVHGAGILASPPPAGASEVMPGAPASRAASVRAALERVFAVDVLGAAELFEAVEPVLRRQIVDGRVPGAIVSLIAAEALYGDAELVCESVGKAGLLALTRSMSHRVAPLGVACNAVIPMAGTRQANVATAWCDDRQAFQASLRPLTPTLVANLIAWLCTPLAAGINGQVFMARGREVMVFSQGRPANSFFQSQILEPDELAQSMKALRRDLADDWSVFDAFGNDPIP